MLALLSQPGLINKGTDGEIETLIHDYPCHLPGARVHRCLGDRIASEMNQSHREGDVPDLKLEARGR